MIKIGAFRVYCGVHVYDWWMLGIGWKADWFLGFSIKRLEGE